jgi:hypothetical protein
MIKTRRRVGDAAAMVAIELVAKGADHASKPSRPPAGKTTAPAAPQS